MHLGTCVHRVLSLFILPLPSLAPHAQRVSQRRLQVDHCMPRQVRDVETFSWIQNNFNGATRKRQVRIQNVFVHRSAATSSIDLNLFKEIDSCFVIGDNDNTLLAFNKVQEIQWFAVVVSRSQPESNVKSYSMRDAQSIIQ